MNLRQAADRLNELDGRHAGAREKVERLLNAARNVNEFDWYLIATECPMREGDEAQAAILELCEAAEALADD